MPYKGTKLTLKYAQQCKDAGIRLVIVGIIHDQTIVNVQRWQQIASNSQTDVMSVATFKQLTSLVDPLTDLLMVPGIKSNQISLSKQIQCM